MVPRKSVAFHRRRCCGLCIAAALLSALCGCPPSQSNAPADKHPARRHPTVRLLIIDDQPLVKAIEREWKASGRGEIEIRSASAKDLDETKRLAADCIIYPSAMLGDLAQRHLIAPLPYPSVNSEDLARSDILPMVRLRETTWGSQVMAVPFGSPQLMLLYRKDILEQLGRSPPATWPEYHELASLAADAQEQHIAGNGGSQSWQPVAEPLAKGWAGQLLLARAAAYARHPNHYSAVFDYRTMEPLIDGPPYVRALEELQSVAQLLPSSALQTTPADAQRRLLSGQCAMAITWPTRELNAVALEHSGEPALRCAELPGSPDVYNNQAGQWQSLDEVSRVPLLGISGRLGSITTSARHTRAAADTLLWLVSKEKGPLISTQSTACTLYRSSQVPSAHSWVAPEYGSDFASEYGRALQRSNGRPLSLQSPRLPGREDYLATLDEAVHSVISGRKTPRESLTDAAGRWRDITQKLGEESQHQAYAHSLGLNP